MVWHWSQQLAWFKQPPGPAAGTTSLELLCHFVATTGHLPPIRVPNEQTGTILVPWDSPAAKMIPATLRFWIHALTRTVQYLEKQTGWTLLPGRRCNKIGCLNRLGARHPRAGTFARVTFPHAADVVPLLLTVVQSCSSDSLVRHARKHACRWSMHLKV